MKHFNLFVKTKEKGAMFIEYALVLAFVAVVGVFFMGETGIKDSITSVFGKVDKTIEVAVNGGKVNTNTPDNFFAFINANPTDEINKIFKTGVKFIRPEDNYANITNEKGSNDWIIANDGSWYTAWTDVDMSKLENGTKVKAIVYRYSTKDYYIGSATVIDHKITTYNDPSNSSKVLYVPHVGDWASYANTDTERLKDAYDKVNSIL